MRILVIGDHESKSLWDFYEPSKLEDIDLIISCGDLSPRYLSFLVTMAHAPVLYIHGNHDDKYEMTPPEGCICVDDDLYVYNGITHQYTEKEMRTRIRKLWMKLIRYKGFDILLTHSPAKDINDGEDLPHQGFECFRTLLEKYKPKYFIHGHVHMSYGRKYKRIDHYQDTVIINGYDQYVFDYENPDFSSDVSRAGTHMSK